MPQYSRVIISSTLLTQFLEQKVSSLEGKKWTVPEGIVVLTVTDWLKAILRSLKSVDDYSWQKGGEFVWSATDN